MLRSHSICLWYAITVAKSATRVKGEQRRRTSDVQFPRDWYKSHVKWCDGDMWVIAVHCNTSMTPTVVPFAFSLRGFEALSVSHCCLSLHHFLVMSWGLPTPFTLHSGRLYRQITVFPVSCGKYSIGFNGIVGNASPWLWPRNPRIAARTHVSNTSSWHQFGTFLIL